MKDFGKKWLLGTSVFLGLGVTSLGIWSVVESKTAQGVTVENKTRALEVKGIEQSTVGDGSQIVQVSLRNVSKKPIAVYSVEVVEILNGKKDFSNVERGGLVVGWILRPNEIQIEKFPIKTGVETQLTISAVLFEDGMGDGDPKEVRRLQEIRVGIRMGFQKMLSILKESVRTGESLDGPVLQEMASKIEKLDDEGVPMRSKRGFYLARGYVLMELKDIAAEKNFNGSSREGEITKSIGEIESALLKFSTSTPAGKAKGRKER